MDGFLLTGFENPKDDHEQLLLWAATPNWSKMIEKLLGIVSGNANMTKTDRIYNVIYYLQIFSFIFLENTILNYDDRCKENKYVHKWQWLMAGKIKNSVCGCNQQPIVQVALL